jgi:predicted enzyme involved in methoxymalonyl-ACP biosynthesis
VILAIDGEVAGVDTWLMSCRVLERQVEEVTVNEMMRLAELRGCRRVVGRYARTAKNAMVRDLYRRVGFQLTEETEDDRVFVAHTAGYRPQAHHVNIVRHAYDAG